MTLWFDMSWTQKPIRYVNKRFIMFAIVINGVCDISTKASLSHSANQLRLFP